MIMYEYIPSGEHTKSYWKWPSRNVDFPINSMVIFHCKMLVHQRVSIVIDISHQLLWPIYAIVGINPNNIEYNGIILNVYIYIYKNDSHKVLWFYESREVVTENPSLKAIRLPVSMISFSQFLSVPRGQVHDMVLACLMVDGCCWMLNGNAIECFWYCWLILIDLEKLFFPKSYSYSIPVFKWQNATTIHLLKVSQKWDSLCFPKVTSSFTGCQELVGYRIGANWIQNDIEFTWIHMIFQTFWDPE